MSERFGQEPEPDPVPEAGKNADPEPSPHEPTGLALAREIARSVGARTRSQRPPRLPRARPVEPRSSGAHPDDRDPQTLSRTVERLVQTKGWAADVNVRTLLARWPLLVGVGLAAHSHPEAYAEAVLTVRTDSTAWATQLRQLAPQLVAMLNEQLGQQSVQRVNVLGPDSPSWKKGRYSVRDGRGPRDTYG